MQGLGRVYNFVGSKPLEIPIPNLVQGYRVQVQVQGYRVQVQVQGRETGVRVQCTRVPGTEVQDPETGFGVAIY